MYVSFPDGTAHKVGTLLKQLREVLALDANRSWDVADITSVGLREDVDAGRDRLCAQADVRVALVNPTYLAPGSRERSRVLNCPDQSFCPATSWPCSMRSQQRLPEPARVLGVGSAGTSSRMDA